MGIENKGDWEPPKPLTNRQKIGVISSFLALGNAGLFMIAYYMNDIPTMVLTATSTGLGIGNTAYQWAKGADFPERHRTNLQPKPEESENDYSGMGGTDPIKYEDDWGNRDIMEDD